MQPSSRAVLLPDHDPRPFLRMNSYSDTVSSTPGEESAGMAGMIPRRLLLPHDGLVRGRCAQHGNRPPAGRHRSALEYEFVVFTSSTAQVRLPWSTRSIA